MKLQKMITVVNENVNISIIKISIEIFFFLDDERRIRLGSLDSDVLLDFGIIQNFEKRKNKSAWKKVKDLVKPNRSPVRLMSKVEYPSREISPSESYNTVSLKIFILICLNYCLFRILETYSPSIH